MVCAHTVVVAGTVGVQASKTASRAAIAAPRAPAISRSGTRAISAALACSSRSTVLARTVQALRAERGWSLDQLAARSGVSKGVLVSLEQGRGNPNLGTLARIGDAFGVPVTLLVDVGGQPAVRVSSPDASRVLWRGPAGGTGMIIGATDPPWAVELWRWEVMPGEEFGGDAHAPATREMVWVESGTLTLTVAAERYAVNAGQCARFPASRPHRYDNEGDQPIRLTMVVVIPPSRG